MCPYISPSHNLLSKWDDGEVPSFILNWKHAFLCDRQQRVKIGDCVSTWLSPAGGTPQGTKSGPRDFKRIVKDMRAALPLYKYVDDTTLFEICKRGISSTKLQESANNISQWCIVNKMNINTNKTKEIVINFARSSNHIPTLEINGQEIEKVGQAKLLGVTISNDLSWEAHINAITAKASQRLFFLRILQRAKVSVDKMLAIYCSIVRPVVEYVCQVWHGGLTKEQTDTIENIQERALHIIMPDASYEQAMQIANLTTLSSRRVELCKMLFVKIQNENNRLHHLLPPVKKHSHDIRDGNKYELPKVLK